MPEEKKEEEQKGLSRREFAKKVARSMVGFLVVATLGTSRADVCKSSPDSDCGQKLGDGNYEVDEACGSHWETGKGYGTYDADANCKNNYTPEGHPGQTGRDPDNDCGTYAYWTDIHGVGTTVYDKDNSCNMEVGDWPHGWTNDYDYHCGAPGTSISGCDDTYIRVDRDSSCENFGQPPEYKDETCGSYMVFVNGQHQGAADLDCACSDCANFDEGEKDTQ